MSTVRCQKRNFSFLTSDAFREETIADKETRLDRIEKNLEQFSQDMLILKEFQRETSEQIRELKEAQRKNEALFEKVGRRLDAVGRQLADTGRQLGDMGFVQGEIAEDLFYRNIRHLFSEREVVFDSVKQNLKKKGIAEYDIVASGKDTVLVVEVKNKLTARMVDTFVRKKLPMFKKAFPEYGSAKILAGMGALVVKDEVGKYAQDTGLYVLTQTDEGGAAIFNKKNFRAKFF